MASPARKSRPAAAAPAIHDNAPKPTLDARPDRLDLRDLPYRPPLRSLPGRWPLDSDLKKLLPAYVKAGRILNQGNEGACTGFGLACVTNYLYWLRHLDTPRSKAPPLVSPRMFYELAKLYDEWPGQDYEGSSCRGALKGWHKHGVCSWDLWPYPIDKNNAGVFVRPSPGWDEDATGRPLGVYYRVDKKSVVDIQAAIYEIGAVYVSGSVHDGWGLDATVMPANHGQLPRIKRMARKTGGHAFALVGFNEHGFVVQNSWGRGWGASGFAILGYEDWVTNGTDCWAVALGVPQDLSDLRAAQADAKPAGKTAAKAAPAASGFRVAAGCGLAEVGATLRVEDNPRDDPWPFNHVFAHQPYQPLRTTAAYAHTLVSGNDGQLMSTDFTRARADREGLARELVVERPMGWLKAGGAGKQSKTLKLAVYAHGGLNSENDSIQRIRVLAPYFLANGIYPLFFTWKTGPGETLADMLEDLKHRVIGGGNDDRSAGVLDQLREAAAEAKDRAVEAVGHQFARGVWSEMRENAAGGGVAGHALDLAAHMLRELRDTLAKGGKALEVHLIGHSAGSILLGHLLDRLAGADVVKVASCELHAAACSSGFAVQHYGAAHKAGVLPLQALRLNVLTDANERADGLPSAERDIYGKSLLYLVSRALDDIRKQPLLGMERALMKPDPAWVDDQWAGPPNADVAAWLKLWPGGALLNKVTAPKVRTTKTGDQIDASHGSFDNNIDVMTATLERIRGSAVVAPMEWLDY
ncbi:C1 family peptidase [Roseateles saccharophilus]|uniref:Papain like protease n=1 Tax=Roseateles saccharophilus TaxID=304 RepID=A0A4R3UXI3_ROSSA|nr:C1 family peptidase [Roseateles saccharophilus]MDG0832301.1 peptidase C1 [Roseateles saccharophilus]TCU96995.1 papain like protease [Roseateles saccharophilus]